MVATKNGGPVDIQKVGPCLRPHLAASALLQGAPGLLFASRTAITGGVTVAGSSETTGTSYCDIQKVGPCLRTHLTASAVLQRDLAFLFRYDSTVVGACSPSLEDTACGSFDVKWQQLQWSFSRSW